MNAADRIQYNIWSYAQWKVHIHVIPSRHNAVTATCIRSTDPFLYTDGTKLVDDDHKS